MAIAYDAVSSDTDTAATILTFSHTIGSGDNRLLVVGTSCEDATAGDRPISSVTYNAQAMIQIGADLDYSASSASLWYILEANLPSTGAYDIVITWDGECATVSGGGISLENVKQQAHEATVTGTVATGTTIQTEITTITNNAWCVDTQDCGNREPSGVTADAGQTERYDQEDGVSHSQSGSTKPVVTAGATTLGWTGSQNKHRRQIIAAFEELGVSDLSLSVSECE